MNKPTKKPKARTELDIVIVLVLAVFSILGLVAVVILSITGKATEALLTAVFGAIGPAIGALATALKTRRSHDDTD